MQEILFRRDQDAGVNSVDYGVSKFIVEGGKPR